jgi:hypothetical protein
MSPQPSTKIIRRETFLPLVKAAVESGEYRFARQAALSWLASFPGDMEVTLLQARAILPGGRSAGVIPALELICQKDPFYTEAYRVLADAAVGEEKKFHHRGTEGDEKRLFWDEKSDNRLYRYAVTCLYALGEEVAPWVDLLSWGEPLRRAFAAGKSGKMDEAGKEVQEALRMAPELLPAAALHLLIERATQPALATGELARIYHERWPDCLPISLVLAETRMETGSEQEAVRLLHLCAAADATGQTARRLWGEDHPYRALWPEEMVIPFDQPIPAAVLAKLGWNHLPQGPSSVLGSLLLGSGSRVEEPAVSKPGADRPMAFQPADTQSQDVDIPAPEADATPEEVPAEDPMGDPETQDNVFIPDEFFVSDEAPAESPAPENSEPSAQKRTVRAVESEFERLARKLKQPALGREDGRCPVYVILTSKEGLTAQYGPQTAGVLDLELRRLAGLISHKHGWGSVIFYADDADCAARYGMTPVNPRDPWKIKLALAELDAALLKCGQRIGALLIFGGDAVVPFHRLPNPTDDADGEILSDSPYATVDANYFVPEWPVGRLPGEEGPQAGPVAGTAAGTGTVPAAGKDAGLLLEQLRQVLRYHGKRNRGGRVLGLDWLGALQQTLRRLLPHPAAPNFGYTAAVWQRSSLAVFRPIGAPHTVLASPPVQSGGFDTGRMSAAGLNYYNLHGLEDSPSWYGQRDPLEKGDAVDYPVALTPTDLNRNGHAPRVVFSEACYGGHIQGKTEKESLALRFLSMGTLGVVASTCISYGSVNTPLIAADLLGNFFWQHLKGGNTVGEALAAAKIDLVREMNHRQGFLDGEDQKTLISFVLYGDPLAAYDSYRIQRKAIARSKDHLVVKTIEDGPEESPARLPAEALRQVKSIVAEYLPGAGLDEIHFSRQQPQGEKVEHSPAYKKNGAKTAGGRLVVTVSKQVKTAQYVHKHYIRVTMDESGKPLKLTVSR